MQRTHVPRHDQMATKRRCERNGARTDTSHQAHARAPVHCSGVDAHMTELAADASWAPRTTPAAGVVPLPADDDDLMDG